MGDARRMARTRYPGIYTRGQTADGRPLYVIRYHDPAGRRRAETFPTLGAARDRLAAVKADVARGEYQALSPRTFADYAAELFGGPGVEPRYRGRTSRGIRPQTVVEYRRDVELYVVPAWGRSRLADIAPPDVRRLIGDLHARGLSVASIRNAIAPVRILFAEAVMDQLVRSSPMTGVRVVVPGDRGQERDRVKALTPDELDALLAAADGVDWLLLRFLADTGLRIGELLALQWQHVDVKARRVHVRGRLYRGTLDAPKTRFGVRDVPIPRDLAAQLTAHRLASPHSTDDHPVFARPDGSPWRDWELGRAVLKPAAARAGLVDAKGKPWPSFHTLRHTCASRLFRAGVDVKRVQVILGHHSPAFTLHTYVHLIPGDLGDVSFLERHDSRF